MGALVRQGVIAQRALFSVTKQRSECVSDGRHIRSLQDVRRRLSEVEFDSTTAHERARFPVLATLAAAAMMALCRFSGTTTVAFL